MITHVKIQNYRSFVEAEVDLQPFSLVVGANGSGKSNLFRFFGSITSTSRTVTGKGIANACIWQTHVSNKKDSFGFEVAFDDHGPIVGTKGVAPPDSKELLCELSEKWPWNRGVIPIYNIVPDKVSSVEAAVPAARVNADGSGTAQVLDILKNGDREDLFDLIEENLRRYIPNIEKLSLRTVEEGKKQIQVREKAIKEPFLASELSEGTRIVVALLTILHQQNGPRLLLLEDIDRGLHPRLFQLAVPLMRDIAERNKINIFATTHNPYLVDCFQDNKEAVIIVEKKDGASTLSTLASRLEGLDYDKIDPDDMPLGNLWFSGFVGGVPASLTRRPVA